MTSQSSASLLEMEASIKSIKNQIDILDDKIHTSSGNSEKVFQNIGLLNEQLLTQSSMVEETSSAITQMSRAIESVTKITENRKGSIERLMETAKTGGQKLSATVDIVGEVYHSLDSITEVAEIIRQIAAQTNLLAFNAEIEASNAGEAGRGFSVVAQEIRNLAEATDAQSKQISTDLKHIMQTIAGASMSSTQTFIAFQEIDKEINELHSSLAAIFGNMNELQSGTKHVLDAMMKLSEVSMHVKEASTEINSNSAQTADSMEAIKTISCTVHTGINEISTGISEISHATAAIVTLMEKISQAGINLNEQVNLFKTEQQPAAASQQQTSSDAPTVQLDTGDSPNTKLQPGERIWLLAYIF
jgi:methyl-accepting chemotaxis protein